MQGRRIRVLILVCAAALAASAELAGAQVVLHDGWQTGTVGAIPAGWSQQTIQVPGLGPSVPPRSVDAIVSAQFSITLDIDKDGSETGVTLANNLRGEPGGQAGDAFSAVRVAHIVRPTGERADSAADRR